MNRLLTDDFLQFINSAPSPFHAVKSVKERLVNAGFQELKEKSQWPRLEPLKKYFVCRNQSSIIALVAGGKSLQDTATATGLDGGFSILAAHTDSPCLKVKPVSKKQNCGYLQVGVQLYGGGLWHTWFDRDLSLAGRVIYRSEGGASLKSALVKIDRPILRIPTLAIHLDRSANDKFEFNKETQLTPMIATVVQDKLNQPAESSRDGDKHHSVLIKLLVDNLPIGVKAEDILDFELCLYDTQLSCTGGIYNEFIFSPRLDNLFMSYCSVKALVDGMPSLEQDSNIRVVALFDNEEVGSESAYGAGSSFLEDTLRRVHATVGRGDFEKVVQSSVLVSADMAHAIHPNYSEKHESNHQPKFHEGVVIKQNANQRYATTSVTSSIFKQIAAYSARNGNKKREPAIPLQEFVVRNDSPCGSTIGPILSSKLGMRTIDVGCPQLSMHSIRECAATTDLKHAVDLFVAFYEDFAIVDKSTNVD